MLCELLSMTSGDSQGEILMTAGVSESNVMPKEVNFQLQVAAQTSVSEESAALIWQSMQNCNRLQD